MYTSEVLDVEPFTNTGPLVLEDHVIIATSTTRPTILVLLLVGLLNNRLIPFLPLIGFFKKY